MIRLTGYIDIPENRYAEVTEALPLHIELTRAEAGNLTFEVTPNPKMPFRFDVAETFVDRKAFEFHQTRTRTSAWAQVTKDIPRHFNVEEIED
ncbi:putative quinol monooxygenase [Cognatishimia activa]|uniref:putative quinol monooxygenase n=1 Tax=Cognatishimia activa TaxID=1715691 RepID=UPI00222FC8E6|nr:antibiotic biosynthesis monooxygenase [Cognatishimia activa]UZD91966.1 antibiotic biosynthesis monooxygenase [Cognatishimia activa]